MGRGWMAPALLAAGCATGMSSESDGFGIGEGSDTRGDGDSAPTSDGGDDGKTSAGSDEDGSDDADSDGPPATSAATDDADDGGSSDGCEPTTWARDLDGDGFGDPDVTMEACAAPRGHVLDATDCDDDDPDTYPGATETCGGPDRDCDRVEPDACASCLELLQSGNGSTDGVYTLDLDGMGGPLPALQMYCDQTTDGGGWTLVQRTVWEPAQTDPLRTTFASWETVTLGNPAAGFGYRLQGEAWPLLNEQLEHLLVHEIRQTDGSACEPLYYLGDTGTIAVAGGTATLTGLVADVGMISGTELSSTNSGPSQTCVNTNQGVPWFFGACCATCPTYQGGYWNEPHPMTNYVQTVPDLNGNTEVEVCGGVPQLALNGSNFRGIDSMEYYLR